MTESHFQDLLATRFGDETSVDYEPLQDDRGARTGTRIVVEVPLDESETYRHSQFMRVAEMVGGHDWQLEQREELLVLTIETRHALPDDFRDESAGAARSPHDAYIESLTGEFGAGDSGGAPFVPPSPSTFRSDSDSDDDGDGDGDGDDGD